MLFFSCHSRKEEQSVLNLADSLMSARPDSALYLLESISLIDMKNRSDSAKYTLLLTQARDKNYVKHTTDSLIRLAVDYYDSTDDMYLKAKAHYYLARIYQDANNEPLAIREYLIAMSMMENTTDYELINLLQMNLGYVYYRQELYEKADSLYQRAEQLAMVHSDSIRLSLALSKRGDICMLRKDRSYSKAEEYLMRALNLAEVLKNENAERTAIKSLSLMYSYIGNHWKAISFGKRGLAIQKDTTELGSYYLLLGDAFYNEARHDSAVFYLSKCLLSKNYYTKSVACMRLADIEKLKGNLNQALLWKDRYDAYKDSALQRECVVEVIASEKDTELELYTQKHRHFAQRYQYYISFFCVVLVFLGVYFIYRRRKHRRVVRSLEDEKGLLLQNASEQMGEKETELRNKESEIEQLQVMIGECEGDRIRVHLLKCELDAQIGAKHILFRSIISGSDIYKRLAILVEHNKHTFITKEKILFNEEDWVDLITEVDRISGGFTSHLMDQYVLLNEDDVHFCCLVKIGLSFANISLVLDRSINMMYKRRDSILNKMKVKNLSDSTLEKILEKL